MGVCFRVFLVAALTARAARMDEEPDTTTDKPDTTTANLTHGLESCIALKTSYNKFAVAETNDLLHGWGNVLANRDKKQQWEEFNVVPHGDGVALRARSSNYYIAAERDGQLKANRQWMKEWEKFIVIKNDDGSVSFKTWLNQY